MKDLFAALLFFSFFGLELFIGSLSLWAFQGLVNAQPLSSMVPHYQKSLRLIFPLAILFLLLCFGIHDLFAWARAKDLEGFRAFYLNPTSFVVRNVIYFLIWIFLSLRILKQKHIQTPLILILSGLTATFVSIDWILSLDPYYRSSAFGLVFFLSASLLAYGFHLRRIPDTLAEETLIRMNNIHLALIGSWAYVAFMEFLIVWYGNAPAEVSWLAPRILTTWKYFSLTVILLQFCIPVFLLFFRRFKRSPMFTRTLATITTFMQIIYLLWLILPSLNRDGIHVSFFLAISIVLAVISPFVLPRCLP
jgi:hypothetical protein